jgi:hypothetical protein
MATLSIAQLQPRNVGQKTFLVRVVHQSVYSCEGKPGQSNYARAAGMLVDVGGAALFYTSIGDTVQATSLLWQCEATRVLRVPDAGAGTQDFEKECTLMTKLPQPVPSAKRSFDCLHTAETTPRKIARLEHSAI